MSAGFSYAGNVLGGGVAPTVIRVQISEAVYQGQLVMWDAGIAGAGGMVQVADVASEAHENDQPIAGIVLGVVGDNRAYNSTYYGDGATYSTVQATVKSYGPGEVDIALVTPYTLIRGPMCYTAFGTAPTLLTETSGSSGGTVVTHAGEAITSKIDDFSTVYCRTGANRGQYRVITTGATGSQTVTVPFPNAIAIGDTFVAVQGRIGVAMMDILSTANCINGDAAGTNYYDVIFHEINLEEAGKEYAVFRFLPKALGPMAA